MWNTLTEVIQYIAKAYFFLPLVQRVPFLYAMTDQIQADMKKKALCETDLE